MRELDVRVSSEWMKKNMPELYDGIITAAEMFAEDEVNIFTHEDLTELKEGFDATLTVSDWGNGKYMLATYINDDTNAWFHDDLEDFPDNEIEALMSLE